MLVRARDSSDIAVQRAYPPPAARSFLLGFWWITKGFYSFVPAVR
jgi:hypothetical protein